MKLLKFIIGLCSMLMAYSCDTGHLTSGGVGFFPQIYAVTITDANSQPVLTTSIHASDDLYFYLKAEDDDVNIKTLRITVCTADTSHTVLDGPYDIPLPAQDTQLVYFSNIGPITIDEPAGTYSLLFQIIDETGNVSNDYYIDITII